MNFEKALTLLKEGESVRRDEWLDESQYIKLHDGNIILSSVETDEIPWYVDWSPTQVAILAEDWIVFDDTKLNPMTTE